MKSFKEQANELLLIRKNIEVSPKYGLDEFGERESDNKIETLIQAGEYFIVKNKEIISGNIFGLSKVEYTDEYDGYSMAIDTINSDLDYEKREIEESLTKLKEVIK